MFLDIAIASTFITSSVITIYFASTSIAEEISDRTIFVIFSKTVTKISYLFGNFLGLIFISLILYTFSYILSDFMYNYNHFNLYYVYGGKIHFIDFISVYINDIIGISQNFESELYKLKPQIESNLSSLQLSLAPTVLDFFFISLVNSFFIISISVALSPFIPFGLNLTICLAIFSLGSMESFVSQKMPLLADIIYTIIPRMSLYISNDSISLGINYGGLFLLKLFLYSFIYSCFIIFISSKFLERKEFV